MKSCPARSYEAILYRIALDLTLSGFSLLVRSQVLTTDTLIKAELPEIRISALRIPVNQSSVPYSISVVNIRPDLHGLSLSESLATLPGLIVNARYNYSVGDRITNRGFGARTQFGVRGIRILFDDIPVTFADGQTNLDIIDLQNLSYAEFLRGPGSALYGNASGGVLLLHSKDISDSRLQISIYTTAGSSGLLRWNGQVEESMRRFRFSFTCSGFDYHGYREHSETSTQRAFLKITSGNTRRNNLLLESGYAKFDALNPGSLTKMEASLSPVIANPSTITNMARQTGYQAQTGITWKHRIDTASGFRISAYGVYRTINNLIIGKIILLPQYSGGVISSFNSAILLGSKILKWNGGFEIACRSNFRKNFVNNNGQKGNLIIDQNELVTGSGVFVQLKYPLVANMDLDACLRYDLNYFAVQNHLPDSPGSGKRYMNALDPSVGIVYHLSRHFILFTNISTSFETPTTTELVNRPETVGGFNPELSPSHAVEYETGLRGSGKLLSYDLALYLISTRDELVPYQVANNPGQDFYRNAGSTVHRGGEATLRFVPSAHLDCDLTLTYSDASFKIFNADGVDYSGNKIPGLSSFHLNAELKYLIAGFYSEVLFQSFSRMYVDDANSEAAAGYFLMELSFGHREFNFGPESPVKFGISGGISNIFNRRYISSVTVNAAASRFYEPGPGRAFFVNARVSFSK